MRVMFLNAAAGLGGAERSLLDILASIRQAQPSWALHLMTGASGPLCDEASSLGVTTSVLPLGPALSSLGEFGASGSREGRLRLAADIVRASMPLAAYLVRVRREVRAFGPDILHTNSLKMHVLGAWAAPYGTPVIWHLHDYVGRRPFTARLLRWNARRPSAIVANSQSVADDVRGVVGAGVQVVAVHNGVDLRRFAVTGSRLDLDQLAGLPPTPPGVVRVGLLATFGLWKGHTTFLDALARVPRDLSLRAYVIGGPLYQTAGSQYSLDYLRGYADALGLTGSVGFTGFVSKPEDAIRALDIVVHASTAPEPFGLVIAEAMACGRAVIASEAGGAREIFTPGVDALGHTPGSAANLASRITELARDPEARLCLGRAGRETAERRFDRDRLASDLVPVYQRAAVHA